MPFSGISGFTFRLPGSFPYTVADYHNTPSNPSPGSSLNSNELQTTISRARVIHIADRQDDKNSPAAGNGSQAPLPVAVP